MAFVFLDVARIAPNPPLNLSLPTHCLPEIIMLIKSHISINQHVLTTNQYCLL